mgnify:FL=1
MITINVFTKNKSWKRYIKNPNTYFDKKARLLSKNINFLKKGKFNFSIMLAGNKEIKELNKKYRKKNCSTDVLSFPFQKEEKLQKLIKLKESIYLGDVIVNYSKIKKNLQLNQFNLELNKLWIHGLLHLLGYKHKKNKEYKLMLRQEKKMSFLIN